MVTAHSPYIYAYTDHHLITKAAKIPGGTVLTSFGLVEGSYRIEKLADNGGAYAPTAEWWVSQGDVEVTTPTPGPEPEPPVDDLAEALEVLRSYGIKGILLE
jgi:hypothetical protein